MVENSQLSQIEIAKSFVLTEIYTLSKGNMLRRLDAIFFLFLYAEIMSRPNYTLLGFELLKQAIAEAKVPRSSNEILALGWFICIFKHMKIFELEDNDILVFFDEHAYKEGGFNKKKKILSSINVIHLFLFVQQRITTDSKNIRMIKLCSSLIDKLCQSTYTELQSQKISLILNYIERMKILPAKLCEKLNSVNCKKLRTAHPVLSIGQTNQSSAELDSFFLNDFSELKNNEQQSDIAYRMHDFDYELKERSDNNIIKKGIYTLLNTKNNFQEWASILELKYIYE